MSQAGEAHGIATAGRKWVRQSEGPEPITLSFFLPLEFGEMRLGMTIELVTPSSCLMTLPPAPKRNVDSCAGPMTKA